MSYLTPAQLIEGNGALLEMAQLHELEPLLLAATIANGDRGEWSAEQRAAADAALASILMQLMQASSEVDTFLVRRGYALPLSAATFPVLSTWTRMIARYHIQQQRDRSNEESGRIERDYRSALQALAAVAAGQRGLGAGDPLLTPAQASATDASFESNPRLFTRDAMRGF